ncbi:hypothetical protein RIF29_10840 [Crotalaria pallida]|uniref:Uncharacterized protein n=1 Tax=Crotalaria pallida TaxID=3830 RepID=A0AAN9IKW2_CROPI
MKLLTARGSQEVHDRAGKRRGKRGKKNAVPLALESACFGPTEGQTIDHEIKEENKDDDYDDDAHHRRRPVHNPVLNANLFLEEDDEANAKKPTEFRKYLIEELKKPYCQEEYKRLFKEITKRKPTQGQKVLRGRTKIYDKKHIAKSYLHHHVDLARKIDKVCHDHHKVLILLRGFFYWLKIPPLKTFTAKVLLVEALPKARAHCLIELPSLWHTIPELEKD